MKKFLEPEVQIFNLVQDIVLLASTPSTPTEGDGNNPFDITNLG